ncbi:MAG: ROK family protein [Acidiferrobacterales bacterium]|nr:ROK family protein [Acidiferrobacterales bacterium]
MTTLQTRTQHYWGVDLGGTKIECAVLRSATRPETLARQRINTEADQGYQHVLKNIAGLIDATSQRIGLKPDMLGIGTPGTLDATTGLLRGSNSQNLQNQPIREDLQNLLGIPVLIENDANCFALAETRLGAASKNHAESGTVFGIIMGTGVGGGLVLDGQLISGRNQIAGEWGHNFLHASGGNCYCGKSGCVETIISGPALEAFFTSKSGQTKNLYEITSLAREGHPHAVETINRLVQYFGIGVSSIINMLDPDMILIGGGVGNIDALYSAGVEAVAQHIFSPTMQTTIAQPTLGDSAGVFGAALLTS